MFTNIYNNLQIELNLNLFNHKFLYYLSIRKLISVIKLNYSPISKKNIHKLFLIPRKYIHLPIIYRTLDT